MLPCEHFTNLTMNLFIFLRLRTARRSNGRRFVVALNSVLDNAIELLGRESNPSEAVVMHTAGDRSK